LSDVREGLKALKAKRRAILSRVLKKAIVARLDRPF